MRIQNKLIALGMLLIHGISVFYPATSYALTSGPTQPEASQFQPASITNLVDPFSGDFSYNIPLLDVDGYPLNLAYRSGGGMDDESSWVGYGWTLNPGSLDRNMKGLPDDFNGTDQIKKEYNIRPDITGGISFNASTEIFGLDFLGANASVDIFYNNHKGLGVEIGAGISATLNTAKHVAGEYTGGLSAGGSLGITSNSQTGADFNFGVNLGTSLKDKENNAGALGFSFGGSLNSRAGLKSTTLGASFNTSKKEKTEADTKRQTDAINAGDKFAPLGLSKSTAGGSYSGSFTTSYGQAFNPTITMPMKNESYSLAPQLGPDIWGFQLNLQATGHYTKQSLQANSKLFPAYGYLHSQKGRTDPNAILDFNREKDVPYMESTPTLAVPYVTGDVFTANSHLGSSQFKATTNSSGVFFDSYGTNTSNAFSLGAEIGPGPSIKGGIDLSFNGSNTVTRKWNNNNDFLQNGDFSAATGVDGEDTYFKVVGEKTPANKDYLNRIAGTDPVKVVTDDVNDDAKAFSTLASNSRNYAVTSKIARNKREPKGEMMLPLTASQAQNFALDKTIKNYDLAPATGGLTCNNGTYGTFNSINRVGGTHKGHHLSEISVVKNDGLRLSYGIPVYNNEQTDVTFNTNGQPDGNNMVNYSGQENSPGNRAGLDFYFSKETVPAYATSFLISGVQTPDYVDLTGNGISDDDLGTAVKFNYSMTNAAYKWRTPNGRNGLVNYANFNEGAKSQNDDNKASYSYGNKELWYAQSIESKNMIAIFRTSDRQDGVGYNPDGSLDMSSKQKRLDRIDLYTKAELAKNPTNPTPIKTVHFEYDYSLFPGVPNNASGGGKLTLKSVYFTYANSNQGNENRYYFTYNPSGNFEYQQYDRWGTYKDKSLNNSVAGVNLGNNEFPYSTQDKTKADQAVQKWQLSEIELPSGGKIKVEYESDDYAFVQNKRAMQMTKIVGYGSLNNYSNYQETDKIYVQLPAASTNDKVGWEYFEGVDQLYFKTLVNLDNNGANELVSGYAKVLKVEVDLADSRPDVAVVTVEKRGSYHPVAAAAWQHLRMNLPKLAYPYSVDESLGPIAFVKALIAAIRNVGELLTPFETKAMRQKFASKIVPGTGFARVVNKYNKLGGGLRVKKITMNDIWSDMVGSANGATTTSGMVFDYTKKYKMPDGTEQTISSGVASYEPMPGSEENPFKQPIGYQQKQHLTSNIYTVEEPLGESYFPAPSVGYSQVTIRNLDAEGNVVNNGYVAKKFYTAKDFPTIVKRTDLSKNSYNQTSVFGLFNIDNGNSVVLSQGFYVETNDMHGKPLSEENFDGSGKMLSGSYYHYKSSGTEQLTLDNNTLVLKPDGTVQNELVGQEFEMYHDMREQITDNIGVNVNINLDVLFLVFIVVPIPTVIPIVQSTYTGYQSASTIKLVNRYAIADKVTTIENGSTMTSENVLWDELTGQVLLTKTQNGFDDPVYNFTLPAYLVNDYEKGMGAAYKNTGIIFKSVNINDGQIPGVMNNYVVPGDQLGVEGSNTMVWAMNVPGVGTRLIKRDGGMYTGSGSLVLLRSGRRNLIEASSYSVISLKNPIRNGRIEIDQSTEVLSTSATTFSDEWTADSKNTACFNTEGFTRTAAVMKKAATDTVPKPTKLSAATKAKFDVLITKLKKNNFKDAPLMKGRIQGTSLKASIASVTTTSDVPVDCPDISNFQFIETTCDGLKPAILVTYIGPPGGMPAKVVATFNFTLFCSDRYMESQSASVTATSPGLACWAGLVCKGHEIRMTGMSCEEFGGGGNEICEDLSLYNIEHTGDYDGTCVNVTYIGSAPFPPNKTVYFVFKAVCNGVVKRATAVINAANLTGSACGIEGRQCSGGSAVLENWYCTDGEDCDPCNNPTVYTIKTGYGNPATGKIEVYVNYNCSKPFPADKIATLTFAYTCPGTNYVERKSIQISATNQGGTLYFVTPSSPPGNDCATQLSNLHFEGVTCGPKGNCCPPPVNTRINPYYTGLKGNWRGKQSFAYTTDRDARIDPINAAKLPTNLRKGGIFTTFTSFYKVEGGKFVPRYNTDSKWVAASTVTKVNTKGQEVENKDALDKYSAAQFGFNDLIATAVSSNARSSEVAYDGFEDYNYNTACGSGGSNSDTCTEDGHFNFRRALRMANSGLQLTDAEAHTGNYSVMVEKGSVLGYTNKEVSYSLADEPKFDFNANNEMILRNGGVLAPFKPLVGKKYILSGWIKGDVATASNPEDPAKAKIVFSVNGQSYTATAAKAGPKVEGWTRVMTTVEIPAAYASIPNLSVRITLLPGEESAYFDDIRLHPYDANMKTFAYDYRTTRLMAELDENNYATFFEYNDEGKLLRNKKETEKGIVTLKETRSRVRKNLR